MIVISSNLVLNDDGLTLDHPIIGYRNIVTVDNIAADTAHADYPETNLANPATNSRWQASTTAAQYLTVTTGSADPIDYVAVARHNFGSVPRNVSIEGDDGGGYDELVAPSVLGDDGPVIFRFNEVSLSAIRIKLASGDAVARAAVVYVGKLLVLPRKIYQGHTPIVDGRISKVTTGKSESGEFTGRIVLNEFTQTVAGLSLIDPDYYREHIRDFISSSKANPFFWGWRPESYPAESGYAWMTNDPKPVNAAPSGLVSIDLQMNGIV